MHTFNLTGIFNNCSTPHWTLHLTPGMAMEFGQRGGMVIYHQDTFTAMTSEALQILTRSFCT